MFSLRDLPLMLPLLLLTVAAFPLTVAQTRKMVSTMRRGGPAAPQNRDFKQYLDFMLMMGALFVTTMALYVAAVAPSTSFFGSGWRSTLALIYPWAGFIGAVFTPLALFLGYRRVLQALWVSDDGDAFRHSTVAGRYFGLAALFLLSTLYVQHLFLVQLS